MLETLFWLGFVGVVAVGIYWLAMKWIKEPREGRTPR